MDFKKLLRYASRPLLRYASRPLSPLLLGTSVRKFEKCGFEWMNVGKTITFLRIKN